MTAITYKTDPDGVNWQEMFDLLIEDDFHNGRTLEQYRVSFENSYAICIAYADGRIIGTVRVLSDGVCNAYIVDVWTYSSYRKQGIARRMMDIVMQKLEGQHVYLFTDDVVDFYEKLGFQAQHTGMGRVVGNWLQNETRQW